MREKDLTDGIGQPLHLDGESEQGRGIAMKKILCDVLYCNDAGNGGTLMVKRRVEQRQKPCGE